MRGQWAPLGPHALRPGEARAFFVRVPRRTARVAQTRQGTWRASGSSVISREGVVLGEWPDPADAVRAMQKVGWEVPPWK